MLVLTRKKDQTLVIGDHIEITVLDIQGDQIRLGIDAPKSIKVYRKEIYLEIQEENIQAARAGRLSVVSDRNNGVKPATEGKLAVNAGVDNEEKTAPALKASICGKTEPDRKTAVRKVQQIQSVQADQAVQVVGQAKVPVGGQELEAKKPVPQKGVSSNVNKPLKMMGILLAEKEKAQSEKEKKQEH